MMLVLLVVPLKAQYNLSGMGGGVGLGAMWGDTELKDQLARLQWRSFLRYGLVDHLQVELGGGLGRVAGDQYEATLIPIDFRLLLSPLSQESWNPFIYAGGGAVHYKAEQVPPGAPPVSEVTGWAGNIPLGAGLQINIDDRMLFEASGGVNFTSTDKIKGLVVGDRKDRFWGFLVGLTTCGGESGDADPDKDGLTNREEKQLGTDPHNADTDGDGLTDGEEVLKYKTNPLKADTDGDGLTDGDEILKYKTDPLKADTDGDGLSDADEILKYKTDPLNPDTDGDGLTDGDEVLKYKTDPLKADTDGGTVPDGVEVKRGTDPLNPNDDIPKKAELKVEVGTSIVLEGVVFKTGSADITPESQDILEKAYNTLAQNPDIQVEIQGYTDNVGKRSSNLKLSTRRADAVKTYLVAKGISDARITTKGFGPDKPIVPNTTTENKQTNRRIEFFRTK
jgi:outer membrane protein OmpA-like peptidoglycan-associated protein